MSELAFKIRRLRELHQLSQEDMAFELGISQPAYSKMERGVTDIAIYRLQKIANILNCSAGDLMEKSAGELMKQFIDCSLPPPRDSEPLKPANIPVLLAGRGIL